MTARQIEQALLAAAPEDRVHLAARLIALAMESDDVLSPAASSPDDGASADGRSGRDQ